MKIDQNPNLDHVERYPPTEWVVIDIVDEDEIPKFEELGTVYAVKVGPMRWFIYKRKEHSIDSAISELRKRLKGENDEDNNGW